MIVQMTLSALVHACAPKIAPKTELAVIRVESGGRPWSINDDTARRSYRFATAEAAIAKARELLHAGHNLDLGLTQLNTFWLHPLRLDVAQAFSPCTNVWAGSTVLARSYAAAAARYGPGKTALYHAFEAYNSGRLDGAARYADAVWRAGAPLAD